MSAYVPFEYGYTKDQDVYATKEVIGGISLKDSEVGCVYFYDYEWFHLIYSSGAACARLKKLKIGKTYSHVSWHFKNGAFESKHEMKFTLLGVHASLLTNNPERWAVIIYYKNSNEN